MSTGRYSDPDDDRQGDGELRFPDIVTVAQAASRRLWLTKTFWPDRVETYAQVKHFNFFEFEVDDLLALARLVIRAIGSPRVCLVRGRIKDRANARHVVRKWHGQEATLIEQPRHWFALDIDGYGTSTGNIERDAEWVLLGLGLYDYEAFVLASSSYGIKPGIHLRIFMWAEEKVRCADLKRFFSDNRVKADLAIFGPVQPIYIATPVFRGVDDPVVRRWTLLAGKLREVRIPVGEVRDDSERYYTRDQAEAYLVWAAGQIDDAVEGQRHSILYRMGIFIGKMVGQGLVEYNEAFAVLMGARKTWGKTNMKKDSSTLNDALKDGIKAVGGDLP